MDAGANVNDADAWGVSATTMAAHAGFADLVEWLLDRGADPNAADAGFTALHAAIMRRQLRDGRAHCSPTAPMPNAPVKTWTPTRRSSKDYNFAPGARRRDAVLAGGALQRTRRHAAAAEAWRRRDVRPSRQLSQRRPGRAPHAGDHRADGRHGHGRRCGVGATRSPRAGSADARVRHPGGRRRRSISIPRTPTAAPRSTPRGRCSSRVSSRS